MIISRAPYRISFFGGGTDYPDWYNQNGGSVLSTSINKYSYITCRYLPQFFEYKYRIRYYKREEVGSVEEIEHPVIRECLKMLDIKEGIDIVHHGDLPAQSGIGSSSTFTVGLLHALYALKGKMPTKRQLAIDAIRIEQKILKEAVGSQDQIASAFGGLNMVEFGGKDEFRVQPVVIKRERLEKFEQSLVLIFTGITRSASELAREQIINIEHNIDKLKMAQKSVELAIEILQGEYDISEIGVLLRNQWELKKSFSKGITNNKIDQIYNMGLNAGALGGKLLGAGGGGFMLFYIDERKRKYLLECMRNFVQVPFSFESSGSQIIYHSNQN
jgi:D-glycero-alpha-D-manno-heptose-7-phosphate kinase